MSEVTRDAIIGEALTQGATWDELTYAGPGKFQGNQDRPLTAAVHYLANDPDEQTGDVESPIGHVARVERWLALTDSQGFVSVIEYDNAASARIAFKGYESEYEAWDGSED